MWNGPPKMPCAASVIFCFALWKPPLRPAPAPSTSPILWGMPCRWNMGISSPPSKIPCPTWIWRCYPRIVTTIWGWRWPTPCPVFKTGRGRWNAPSTVWANVQGMPRWRKLSWPSKPVRICCPIAPMLIPRILWGRPAWCPASRDLWCNPIRPLWGPTPLPMNRASIRMGC